MWWVHRYLQRGLTFAEWWWIGFLVCLHKNEMSFGEKTNTWWNWCEKLWVLMSTEKCVLTHELNERLSCDPLMFKHNWASLECWISQKYVNSLITKNNWFMNNFPLLWSIVTYCWGESNQFCVWFIMHQTGISHRFVHR